jgi:hypothetical protein
MHVTGELWRLVHPKFTNWVRASGVKASEKGGLDFTISCNGEMMLI